MSGFFSYRLIKNSLLSTAILGYCALFAQDDDTHTSQTIPARPVYTPRYSFSLQMGNSDLVWEKLNRIHDGSKQIFGMEYSRLLSEPYRMHGWISAGYQTKGGTSTLGGFSTRYHYFPFGFGVKHTVPLTKKIGLNVGAGAVVSLLRIRNNSPLVESVICRWSSGAIAKAQLEYSLSQDFFVGAFVDYIYQRFSTKSNPEQGNAQVIDFTGAHYGIRFGWRW